MHPARGDGQRSFGGRPTLRSAVCLVPAALAAALAVGLAVGPVGSVLALGLVLVAPGWLAWEALRRPISADAAALPALWATGSLTVLLPVIAPTVFFGWPVAVAHGYLVVALAVLGIVAGRRPPARRVSWSRGDLGVLAASLLAMAYRGITWRASGDTVAYVAFLRVIESTGAYPAANPFMAVDLPLATRWRIDGWTGITGVVSRLGETDPEALFVRVLPAVLVAVAASALYLLARLLGGDGRLARAAAVAGLGIPLLTDTAGKRKSEFVFWYRSIAENKYAGLVVFLPVVAGLMIAAYRSRRRSDAVVAAGTLAALMWVHPLSAVFAVMILAAFVVIDGLRRRPKGWRSGARVSAAIVAPVIVMAMAITAATPRFGVSPADAGSLTEFAYPAHEVGPLTIWGPRSIAPNDDGATPEGVFISGHATHLGAKVAFLSRSMPVGNPWFLFDPANLFVVLAIGAALLGRDRSPAATWILATSVAAISVFTIPPVAALVARFVTPWQLWRFSWLLPVPFAAAWLWSTWTHGRSVRTIGIALGAVLAVVFVWSEHRTWLQTEPPPGEARIMAAVEDLDGLAGTIIAETRFTTHAVSRWVALDAVAYRGVTVMSNSFPSSRRDEALARLQDADAFLRQATSTEDRRAIAARYGVDYVVVEPDSADLGLEAAGFERSRRLAHGYVLYRRTGLVDAAPPLQAPGDGRR